MTACKNRTCIKIRIIFSERFELATRQKTVEIWGKTCLWLRKGFRGFRIVCLLITSRIREHSCSSLPQCAFVRHCGANSCPGVRAIQFYDLNLVCSLIVDREQGEPSEGTHASTHQEIRPRLAEADYCPWLRFERALEECSEWKANVGVLNVR